MSGIPVTFVGEMFYSNLGVGGGPMPGGPPLGIWGGAPIPVPTPPIYYPPQGPVDPGYGVPIGGPPRPTHPIYNPVYPAHPIAPGGPPPQIWPSPGVPTHPIVLPPITPGGPPVQIWPSPGVPTHPIVMPPLPEAPPDMEAGGKPPPPEGGWGFHPEYGWGYFPSGGQPGPKK